MEETVDAKVKEEMDKVRAREEAIKQRCAELKIIHEHIIVIQRMDNIDTLTFLAVAEKSIEQRRRSSWYGKIIVISPVDCGDDVIEKKKALMAPGDFVSFNPETAYSLNIAGFEEIWILHVDNVLVVDTVYDYLKAREENLKKRMDIQVKAQLMRIR